MSRAVSIIIPVYNSEKYLEECIDSILNQTFQDFEIICVNDGSTDGSLEILKNYQSKDSRFIIVDKPNEGAGFARNTGLDRAEGKYIQFLDSDDYFEPDMIEGMYTLAEDNNSEIVVCSARKVDGNGNVTESGNPNFPINIDKIPFGKVFNYKDFSNEFFSLLGSIVWNKMYSRKLLQENNLRFPRLTASEDLCFSCMSGICAERIIALKDEFINYRFNRPNSIQTYRADYAIDVIKSALYVREFLQKRGIFDEFKTAWLNTYVSSARWETVLCNDEQYEKFERQLKELMPEEWQIFSSALRNSLTLDKFNDIIADKKVMLWGASYYLRNLLKDEKTKNTNILGIVDRNTASWGQNIGNYRIYPPDAINELKPDGILLTVYNNNEIIYDKLKEDLAENYQNVELLPNIWRNND